MALSVMKLHVLLFSARLYIETIVVEEKEMIIGARECDWGGEPQRECVCKREVGDIRMERTTITTEDRCATPGSHLFPLTITPTVPVAFPGFLSSLDNKMTPITFIFH